MNEPVLPGKSTLKKRLAWTGATSLVFYLAACVIIACCQRQLLYHPPVVTSAFAEQMGRKANLERWTNSAGAIIGWKRLSRKQPAQGRALILYGTSGWTGICAHYVDDVQYGAAFDGFILEYPGYGDRPGVPSEKNFFSAAEEALQLAATNGPIYLIGESLGTGVAAYLAGTHPSQVAGVLLFAPYNRLTDVAQYHFPIFPVSLLLLDRFPSEDYLKKFHGSVGVLIGEDDHVVPPKFGRRLYDGYAGPKRLWDFPIDNHGTLFWRTGKVWNEIHDFWRTNSTLSYRGGEKHPILVRDSSKPDFLDEIIKPLTPEPSVQPQMNTDGHR
jgi:pimeloyl-ACP methyl ester carboxylesterase